MSERGFTLLEVVIVAAIGTMLLFAAIGMAEGSHPYAMRSSATLFDAAVAQARALAASSGNGSTIVLAPAASGTVLTVYSGRPNGGAFAAASLPPPVLGAKVSEAALGGPPFTVFFDSAGHASGMAGAPTSGSTLSADPGCPSGERALSIAISDARATAARTFVCRQ
jgi:prepilin-type N-terminal cleavage/methylation domain-containing protein